MAGYVLGVGVAGVGVVVLGAVLGVAAATVALSGYPAAHVAHRRSKRAAVDAELWSAAVPIRHGATEWLELHNAGPAAARGIQVVADPGGGSAAVPGLPTVLRPGEHVLVGLTDRRAGVSRPRTVTWTDERPGRHRTRVRRQVQEFTSR